MDFFFISLRLSVYGAERVSLLFLNQIRHRSRSTSGCQITKIFVSLDTCKYFKREES